MTVSGALRPYRPVVLAVHVLALMAGLVYAWLQWNDIAARQATLAVGQTDLAALEARLVALRGKPSDPNARPLTDPFMPGSSATVAGANLQDLVVTAIREAGGTVTSSQIEPTETGTTPAAMQLTVNCQIESTALQGLLYRLESQTPALFFDQLSIDTSGADARALGSSGAGPLKIAMTVSTYWVGSTKS